MCLFLFCCISGHVLSYQFTTEEDQAPKTHRPLPVQQQDTCSQCCSYIALLPPLTNKGDIQAVYLHPNVLVSSDSTPPHTRPIGQHPFATEPRASRQTSRVALTHVTPSYSPNILYRPKNVIQKLSSSSTAHRWTRIGCHRRLVPLLVVLPCSCPGARLVGQCRL